MIICFSVFEKQDAKVWIGLTWFLWTWK
jgi:hypothetical protein